MMTQLITATSDPTATIPTDTPDSSDSHDDSSDGFAILLTALCAAPVPMTMPVELAEAAPVSENAATVAAIESAPMIAVAIEAAPSPLALLPGESSINLNPTGLTADSASLPVPANAAA